MVCEVLTKNGKAVMFICNRSARRPKCSQCGRPSTKLCDFPLGGRKKGKTCDKPLCSSCATEVDVERLPEQFELPAEWFVDKKPRRVGMEFDPDTVDVCPAHARFINAKDIQRKR